MPGTVEYNSFHDYYNLLKKLTKFLSFKTKISGAIDAWRELHPNESPETLVNIIIQEAKDNSNVPAAATSHENFGDFIDNANSLMPTGVRLMRNSVELNSTGSSFTVEQEQNPKESFSELNRSQLFRNSISTQGSSKVFARNSIALKILLEDEDLRIHKEISKPRKILEEFVENDNDGYLSPSKGFLPSKAPLTSFYSSDKRVKAWDDLVDEMKGGLTLTPSKFRQKVDAIDCLPVDILSEDELLRAVSVMGNILTLYWWTGSDPQMPRQDLMDAWGKVRERLGWYVEDEDGGKHYSPFFGLEFALYSWTLPSNTSGEYDVDDLNLDNIALLVPQMLGKEFKNWTCASVVMMARAAKLPLLCVLAQEAAAKRDDDLLADALFGIVECLGKVTDAFEMINPHHGAANNFVNPAFFSKFINYSVSMPSTKVTPDGKKIINPSTGQAFPIFQLMDAFFQRRRFTGKIGKDVAITTRLHPKRWKNFIAAIREPDGETTVHIGTYVKQSGNRELEGLYQAALQRYAGKNGLLDRHTLKMYGYLSLLFRTGRDVTNGTISAGHPLDRTEDLVSDSLKTQRRDRLHGRSQEEIRHIGKIHGKPTSLGSDDSNMFR